MIVLITFCLKDELHLREERVEVQSGKVRFRRKDDFIDAALRERVRQGNRRVLSPCPRRDSSVFVGRAISQWHIRSVGLPNEQRRGNIGSRPTIGGIEDVTSDPVTRRSLMNKFSKPSKPHLREP